MRKQASESPEVTGGLGGSQIRSVIGASGRPGASPERGGTVPFQGTWPCRAGIIATREGQGRSAYAGRGSGHLALALMRRNPNKRTQCGNAHETDCGIRPNTPEGCIDN
jgi:hypothetical protein